MLCPANLTLGSMSCPRCASSLVLCTFTETSHAHECQTCFYRNEWALPERLRN